MSSTNKGLLGRYVDAYNRDAMDELAAFVAIDYVHHSSGRDLTIEQFKKGAAWMRAGLPVRTGPPDEGEGDLPA